MQISFLIWNRWNIGLQTVANQFLNMEPLENGVANSCKSVFKYRIVEKWGCKPLQISFEIWNRWNMGLQTVEIQLLTMEPLEHGVAKSCKSASNHGTIGTRDCKQLQISF